jgi:FKBP-type peptidyl-prolyl cis-trans isomerase
VFISHIFQFNNMRLLGLSLAFLASAAWIVLADDGLKIDVTQEVECERKTKEGDNIGVHYKGTLTDGTVFDSSYNRGQPFSFVVGAGRVIKGLDYNVPSAMAFIGCSMLIYVLDGIKGY